MKDYFIVKTYFDKRHGIKDDDWLHRRIELFQKYTLESLRSQTYKNFKIWICCAEGIQEPMKPLQEVLTDAIFTYGEHFTNGMSRQERAKMTDCDRVAIMRIDSDDVYRYSAIQTVREYMSNLKVTDEPQVLLYQVGYLYDINDQRLGIYRKNSSPFHTLMFAVPDFMSPSRYAPKFCGDHSMVAERYKFHVLPQKQFCVLIHGDNFSSTFNSLVEKILPDGHKFSVEKFIRGTDSL
jgi:hypothetical protein